MEDLKKNEIYEADITGYTSQGLGVCRISGRAVFVRNAILGERWRVRITKVSGSAIFGRGEECLLPSSERIVPECPAFGRCGGCDLLHMSYGEELRMKLSRVNDALDRIAGVSLRADGIVPADDRRYYRNKAVYAVGQRDGRAVYGFYMPRSHEIVAAPGCLLQNNAADRCAATVCDWMNAHGIRAWDEASRKGSVRHVFTRSARDGRTVCCVVSASGFGGHTASLAEALRAACPELVGLVLCINKEPGNTVLSGSFYTLWGESELCETLCGFEFSLSPQAFFQVNPRQAERLYDIAVAKAVADGADTVLDLYCGAGTISLCLARRAARVIGAEIVPEAVDNARLSAARNGVGNAEFICADAGDAASELKTRGIRPDAVVVDPPRKGMDEAAVSAICAMEPRRIVYVSCDPATLARDIARFEASRYRAIFARAVDMFPGTCHVETVCVLSLGSDSERITE